MDTLEPPPTENDAAPASGDDRPVAEPWPAVWTGPAPDAEPLDERPPPTELGVDATDGVEIGWVRTGGTGRGVVLGTVTAGTVTLGTVTAGTVMVGTVMVGTVMVGTVTVGTVTVGTVTVGTVTVGTVRAWLG